MPCCGPSGSERGMLALLLILLAFVVPSAFLMALLRMLLSSESS